MTGRPAAFIALALASTASVADSEIAEIRAEMRGRVMRTIVPDAPLGFPSVSAIRTHLGGSFELRGTYWFDVGTDPP
ncbi:hypothetical protein Pth03_65440 [Planotetraspora thailandica]|uniref:Uncharacterized protein n=1 Tax=Planotetraspora thailandica TaxID=487172 RepID=A0A8J4DDE4_9ACTN|nr:hypothetical protein Pth03_65440 [Planotetraspora thailandica]